MPVDLVKIYHRLAQLSPEDIFGNNSPLIAVNQPEDGRTASPGWVGKNYDTERVVFMGINPGGGTGAYATPRQDDAELYSLLRTFKKAQGEPNVTHAFQHLNEGWIELQKKHNIWRLLSALLDALALDVQQVAYLNLVPFRTREDKIPDRQSLDRAWNAASGPQLAILKPKRLFLLGKKVTNAFSKLPSTVSDYEVFSVPRTIGDNYLSDQAKHLIDRLKKERKV